MGLPLQSRIYAGFRPLNLISIPNPHPDSLHPLTIHISETYSSTPTPYLDFIHILKTTE